jgi:RNA polymerase sigma-70 factor (ECF subfamily)
VVSDADLLEAWRAGDRNAGRELFERYIAVLSRFFRNKVGEDREDLIQRTFLACLESRDRLRSGASFRAYILRVARSKLYDHLARKYRGLASPEPLSTSVRDLGTSPSRIALRQQRDEHLLHALRGLPLEHQVLVELHYWEQVSVAELAEIFEIPPGTVKTRLLRARQLLRERIARAEATPRLPSLSLDDLDAWARSLKPAVDEPPPE